MSIISESKGQIILNSAMKNQIASMLKNVIDDEHNDKGNFEEEIHDSIFDQSDEYDNDAETQTNTTIDQIGFLRSGIEKSQTTKMAIPMQFSKGQGKEVFIDSFEISRKTGKKFQTINMKFNPFNQSDCNNDYVYNLNHTMSPFGLGYPLIPMCNNNYLPINYTNNINNSFNQMKINQLKQQQHQIAFNDERMISKIEFMLSSNCSFDKEAYGKLKGTFILLSKNQHTSRLCQCYLEKASSEVIHLIFKELKNQIANLLFDPYANYFCLKLFYYLNKEDRIFFLRHTVELFDVLSINKISTYPIQCIIENVSSIEEKIIISQAAYQCLMKLSIDVYGTHVLEKIIVCFEYKLVKPISLFILEKFCFLANHANGLCIIKKAIIIEYQQEHFDRLRRELIANALMLIQNPYGNYALQTAIDNWDISFTEEIMMQFIGKCSMLSIQKFSSNVIERCIEKCEKFLSLFINEIYLNPSTIIVLLKNNFGNYVIQTALKSAKFNNKNILINVIQSNFDKLSDNKKLICKWKSIILSQMHLHQTLSQSVLLKAK